MAKNEKVVKKDIEQEVITDITCQYFNDEFGNPKVKKTYWNKDQKIKEEIVND